MISVIIPTYNRINALKNAVMSVFSQTVTPLEMIVIDDGSDPEVPEDIFRGSPEACNTILLRNKEPKGACHARNQGIHHASGTWIAFLDDDDTFIYNKIEEVQKCILESTIPFDILYHSAYWTLINEGITSIDYPAYFSNKETLKQMLLVKNIVGGTPMVIARKSCLIDAGGFDETLPALQDYELWLRLALQDCAFHYIDKPLSLCYRTTKGSGITNSTHSVDNGNKLMEKKYQHEIQSLPPELFLLRKQYKSEYAINRAHLNKQYFKAVSLCITAVLRYKKFKYVMMTFLSLFGATAWFKVRAFLSNKLRSVPILKHLMLVK